MSGKRGETEIERLPGHPDDACVCLMYCLLLLLLLLFWLYTVDCRSQSGSQCLHSFPFVTQYIPLMATHTPIQTHIHAVVYHW